MAGECNCVFLYFTNRCGCLTGLLLQAVLASKDDAHLLCGVHTELRNRFFGCNLINICHGSSNFTHKASSVTMKSHTASFCGWTPTVTDKILFSMSSLAWVLNLWGYSWLQCHYPTVLRPPSSGYWVISIQ